MESIIHNPYKYNHSLTEYKRWPTRVVAIGTVPMGGNNPIRVQSMTTTDTLDTKATVEQTIKIFEAGGDYVRITAPSKKEAENLAVIKKELKSRGYDIPLIADIHFTPNAAEIAARIVEKVRINPGNYADKKRFEYRSYSDSEYDEELERIRNKFIPLVKICKEAGTAMRIGTNHGSLSDRILSRYGDTPMGMVESALEFVRVCEAYDYRQIVLSMKASNPKIMVEAYRLLVHQMMQEAMNYPIHLGVTEAGDGEDGRIKSAVGIGSLLEDGIGDTIRVSLTEAPEKEIPVAIRLIAPYENRMNHKEILPIFHYSKDPFHYKKRETIAVQRIGGDNVPVVVADLSHKMEILPKDLNNYGYQYDEELDKWHISDQAADYVYIESSQLDFELPGTLQVIVNHSHYARLVEKKSAIPLCNIQEYLSHYQSNKHIVFVKMDVNDLLLEEASMVLNKENIAIVLDSENNHKMAEMRRVFYELIDQHSKIPVILYNDLSPIDMDLDQLQLSPAVDCGPLFCDGFGDGIWLKAAHPQINSIAFGILQASRSRISKTEYISCPSCGRTLFDLEETTALIRSKTAHLKGVKIGIMGCIVNGPGEMADADYGYVGSGIDKISLYRGQNVVKKNINSDQAVDELIKLIKEDNRWT